MSAQKIRSKQKSNPAVLVGKRSYMLLQNKAIKTITEQAFTQLQKTGWCGTSSY